MWSISSMEVGGVLSGASETFNLSIKSRLRPWKFSIVVLCYVVLLSVIIRLSVVVVLVVVVLVVVCPSVAASFAVVIVVFKKDARR